MVASFSPLPAGPSPVRTDSSPPTLRLLQGGAGQPGPTRSTYLWRRAVAFLLMVTCVVAVAVGAQTALRSLVASPGGGASAASGVTQSTGDYQVQAGDTLWSIAAAVTPVGTDVRVTVDRLVELNGGSTLTAGQQLVLPE